MAPITAPTPITMVIINTITSLSSSIYESSTLTFDNDTFSYTTVNIDLTKLTDINSWCAQNKFYPIDVT